jgi:His/Glu/Gln/Arg/opine family amino acid ABC transporter permease subunit
MVDGSASELIPLLVRGLWMTLVLALVTNVLSLVLGIVVGAARLSPRRWVRAGAIAFVECFRNVPALVLIVFWAFAFPNAFPSDVRQALFFDNALIRGVAAYTGLSVPWYAIAAIIGLTTNTAAYVAELFRAGVATIDQEHADAAQSLGASHRTIFWRLLIPGGIRAAYPAITSRLIHNTKNTALASFVSVPEFFNAVHIAITRSFMAIELLVLAGVVYLALSLGLSLSLRRLEPYLYPRARIGRRGE